MSKFAFYHGTPEANTPSIEKSGLKGVGIKRRYSGHGLYTGERGKSVYLTYSAEDADDWAGKGKNAVYQVDIDRDHPKLKEDKGIEARYVGNIPKEWIKRVK